MAEEYGCAESAIRKKATKEEWPRDLSAKIKAKAEELVRKEEVRTKVRTESESADERKQVEVGAQLQADIVLAHRKDIQRSRGLAIALLAELEAQTGSLELYEQLAELLHKPDEKGVDKLNELYRKVIALPSRIDSAKKLSDTLKTLVGLERQAFGIADDADGNKEKPQQVMVYLPSNGR